MTCPNCNVNNDSNSKYCYNCGNEIKYSKNKEVSLTLGIICLVSSFFVNILCFIPGIISIVYAKKCKKENGKLGVGFGLSLGGMIYSFLSFLFGVIVFVFLLFYYDSSSGEYYDYYEEPQNSEVFRI